MPPLIMHFNDKKSREYLSTQIEERNIQKYLFWKHFVAFEVRIRYRPLMFCHYSIWNCSRTKPSYRYIKNQRAIFGAWAILKYIIDLKIILQKTEDVQYFWYKCCTNSIDIISNGIRFVITLRVNRINTRKYGIISKLNWIYACWIILTGF